MKKRFSFTLVELLVVIGIISVLAGLVFPAVMLVQSKARVTQAKSDMASMTMALKGVENTYGKMWDSSVTELGAVPGDAPTNGTYNDYDNFILELTRPSDVTTRVINVRQMKFLDPKPKYIPNATSTADRMQNQKTSLWRDPWGNQYRIILDNDFDDEITLNGRTFAGKVIMYSFGPNGVDDDGENFQIDDSIANTNADDIASWH